jgi:hypothetical protein
VQEVKRHLATVAVLATTASISPLAAAKPAACHDAHGSIEWMARVDAHTLRLCWQTPDACFTLDVNAKSPVWTPAARPHSSSASTPDPPIPGVTVGMTVNVCGADGKDCRDFVVPPRPVTTSSATYALVNADRSLVAAVTERTITLFDGKGARRGTIESWKPDTVGIAWSFAEVWFFGDRVYVELRAGNDAEIRVFDTTAAKIAELGDGGSAVSTAVPLQLADGTIAVATRYGEQLDLRDKTGKRTKLVDVFALAPAPQLSDRVEYVELTPDGHVAVARGDGSVALVDVASGTHSVLPPPPVCK